MPFILVSGRMGRNMEEESRSGRTGVCMKETGRTEKATERED